MTNEVDVAIVALLVSLVALAVTSGQLIGQMFATADGYRRCQDSVIGPWAEKTRLVWHWSQFRFETKFTTPEIVLYDDLNNDEVSGSLMSLGLKRRFTMKNVVDLKHAQLSMKPSRLYNRNQAKSTNTDAVTWLAFLHQLSRQEDARRLMLAAANVQPDTRIGVIYRERTWDLMPPDMSLPIASSRLGVIVALALRLGMSWENLDLTSGFLRATGNGHTLVSTTIRGLGITFQYTYTDDLGPMQNALLPAQSALPSTIDPVLSKATDFIRCGIIPGCLRLDLLPIPLAGQSIHETARYLRVALQYLGAVPETINHLTQLQSLRSYQTNGPGNEISMPINDMIALCSERWPDLETVPWPLETDVVFSSFLFWECREKYFTELSQRLTQDKASDHMREIGERLTKIRADYADDFFCRWGSAIVTNPLTSATTRKLFLEDLEDIHNWTTRHFQKMQKVAPYRFFAALFVMLMLEANRWAFAQRLPGKELWEAIIAYCVRNLPNLHISTAPYISATGGPGLLLETDMEEAWWTLVLRGISWKMMQHVSTQDLAIPSKFYFDQTPVYIM